MRPPFTYTFSEFIDRLTIVSRKDIHLLPGAKEELDTMMEWMKERGIDGYMMLSIIRIAQANADIWNLEHKLRNAAMGDFPLAEAGKIAIKVREHNKTRVRYMNELDKSVGSEFVAEKINHLSEECYEKFYQQKRPDTV